MYCSAFLAIAALACQDVVAPLKALFPGAASPYLNGSGRVVVYPDSMRSWSFYNDQQGVACTDASVCRLVAGPGGVPSGSGSAELATASTTDGKALILADYKGVRLDQITTLGYSTYRQSADAGNNLAIALQLNVDYDLSDAVTGYQGRLVYEPYHTAGGTVVQSAWQGWNAKAGKWWGTKATVSKNGANAPNACVQSSPCTWAQLLTAFPNLGIHGTYGAVVLKAGSGWASFRGNVDNLTMGVEGTNTTFDFELAASQVPAQAPDSVPSVLWDSLVAPGNLIVGAPGLRGTYVRNVLKVIFVPTATPAQRQAAISLIDGEVVGGISLGGLPTYYIVRIPYSLAAGDSASGPVLRSAATLRALGQIESAFPVSPDLPKIHYLRPEDGAGFTVWPVSRDSGAGAANWGQIAINMPFAWGCVTGAEPGVALPRIAVVDPSFKELDDLTGQPGTVREYSSIADTLQHGSEIASIIGAKGGNGLGIAGMLWKTDLNLYDATRSNTVQFIE